MARALTWTALLAASATSLLSCGGSSSIEALPGTSPCDRPMPWSSSGGDPRGSRSSGEAIPRRPRVRWARSLSSRPGVTTTQIALDGCGRVAVAHAQGVTLLDAEGAPLLELPQPGERVWTLAWPSPDRLVLGVGKEVVAYDLRGRAAFRFTCSDLATALTPGPDGKLAVVCGHTLVFLDAEGRKLHEQSIPGVELAVTPPVWRGETVVLSTSHRLRGVVSGQMALAFDVAWPAESLGFGANVSAPMVRGDGSVWAATAYGYLFQLPLASVDLESSRESTTEVFRTLASTPEGTVVVATGRGVGAFDAHGRLTTFTALTERFPMRDSLALDRDGVAVVAVGGGTQSTREIVAVRGSDVLWRLPVETGGAEITSLAIGAGGAVLVGVATSTAIALTE